MEKLEKNPLKFIAVIIVLTLLCAIGYYYAGSQSSNIITEKNGNTKNINNKITPVSWLIGSNTYANKDYGFELTFPYDWRGYIVSFGDELNSEYRHSVNFKIIDKNSTRGTGDIQIIIISKDFYYKYPLYASGYKFLAENQNNVFVSNDYDVRSLVKIYGLNDSEIKLLLQIPDIMKTFKLIN
ncbi:MAG: hypothetical protein WC793_01560 [Candidatus Paceibacterota bacterium]|jgi:hypothetical protein